MNQRTTRAPESAPLTPDLLGSRDLERVQKERIEELSKEVRKLRAELAYQRRKHDRIEDALGRHFGQLDKTIATMREAIHLLGKELLPGERI